eukprot:23703-Rhodomonas_salina.3
MGLRDVVMVADAHLSSACPSSSSSAFHNPTSPEPSSRPLLITAVGNISPRPARRSSLPHHHPPPTAPRRQHPHPPQLLTSGSARSEDRGQLLHFQPMRYCTLPTQCCASALPAYALPLNRMTVMPKSRRQKRASGGREVSINRHNSTEANNSWEGGGERDASEAAGNNKREGEHRLPLR